MIVKQNKEEVINLINKVLEDKMFSEISKPRKKFVAIVFWLFVSIRGRINFLQLERFSKFCEQNFRIGFQKTFDFLSFNSVLLKNSLPQSAELAVAIDPSYINKAGKATKGIGKFWSGSSGKAKWGLELCGFALIDVFSCTAYHLKAFQSQPCNASENIGIDLLTQYANLVIQNAQMWLSFSKYIVADAYFSKKPFVDKVIKASMHLISRLRDDADLKYLYQGEQKGGKGRPKQYDGKVDVKKPRMDYFVIDEITDEYRLMSAIVYSKALKRKIKLALVVFFNKGKTVHKIYFSTDIEMPANKIFKYYRSRFQMEFVFRDAKQFTGLNHCQARSAEKLNFHWNASLTTVNLAKILHNQDKGKFSMANFKTQCNNELMLERFFEVFGINPNSAKNQKKINELLNFGSIAA